MKRSWLLLLILSASCSRADKYDVARYFNEREQDEVLTSIVTYIYDAPTYTTMAERFLPKHRNYYSFVSAKFSILKYYIAGDGTHYFYVMRPTNKPNEYRGVGGHFTTHDGSTLVEFREEFVTPMLAEADVKGRCAFLFDEMVKGNLEKYLKMETYVQWPNQATYYDTITYEWKLDPELKEMQ